MSTYPAIDGVYHAGPLRRSRNYRDPMRDLGDGPWQHVMLLATAEALRDGAELIGRGGLMARMSTSLSEDKRRSNTSHIYAVGGLDSGVVTFPPKARATPRSVFSSPPKPSADPCALIDTKAVYVRGWTNARDAITGRHGLIWFQAFRHALLDSYSISQCVRHLGLPAKGGSRLRVRLAFQAGLEAAAEAMIPLPARKGG